MVRAQAKTPEEKKETQKKKSTTPKKKQETGVWPCKINGCNKEFAREADLKRHQRTTKLHSLPGFACPQCEATFTRTDALRRHQKSRHNGIIIEPSDHDPTRGPQQPPGQQEPPSAGGFKSRSRSGTPGSKGAAKAGSSHPTPPAAMAQPSTAGPAQGPPGYYRQHGLNNDFMVFVPPRTPQGVLVDPNYPAMGLPTSAARMAQPNWPPPPWAPEGHPMPPYPPIPGAHPGYFQYYRPGMLPPHINPELMGNLPNGAPQPQPQPQPPGQPAPPVEPQLAQGDLTLKDGAQAEGEKQPSAPVIDPSLDSGPAERKDASAPGTPPVTLAITEQAMQAVFMAAQKHLEDHIAAAEAGRPLENAFSSAPPPEPGAKEAEARGELQDRVEAPAGANGDHGGEEADEAAKPPEGNAEDAREPEERAGPEGASQQPQMQQMLTEDGEPMLNPAELLTQESLASPPPS